jgi:hypothetical protein
MASLAPHNTYSVISAANNMTNVYGTGAAMPAFIPVLYPQFSLDVIAEV